MMSSTTSSRSSGKRRVVDASTAEGHREVLDVAPQTRVDEEQGRRSWEVRLAARYHAKLYKEYAIIDLSRYRSGTFGLRWRTEQEVLRGEGVDVCAAKKCATRLGLQSFEVPFAYDERGAAKYELVKVRLCVACARKLTAISPASSKGKRRSTNHHHHRR